MKSSFRYFYSLLIFLFIFAGCSSDSETPRELNLSIDLIGTPVCNHTKSASMPIYRSSSQSCAEYSFDETTKVLSVKHLNTAFNCCPESLYCQVSFRNDTIFIQEMEKSMNCKCNCLYDFEMQVKGLESGKYHLKIAEPYSGNQEKIGFGIDLKKQKTGSFCVSRTQYPWGL
jgi:hypothetical protein